MKQSGTSTRHLVGRPRVTIKPERVLDLRSQGTSWRNIAKALRIGTATAMRLFKSSGCTCPNIRDARPKIPGDKELKS